MILPGVYIEVRPEALIVPGSVTVGNIGIVGTACRGPVGEVNVIGSISEAREIFGGADSFSNPETPGSSLTLVRALELAYGNGASTVFAVRVTSTESTGIDEFSVPAWNKYTKAHKATFLVAGDTPADEVAVLKGRTYGSWGNGIRINVIESLEDSFIKDEAHDYAESVVLDRHPIVESPGNRVRVSYGATGQIKVLSPVYSSTPIKGQVRIDTESGALTFEASEKPKVGDKISVSYFVPAKNSRKVSICFGGVTESYTVADGRHLVELLNDPESPSTLVEGKEGADKDQIPLSFETADIFKEFGKGSDTPGSDGANASASDYALGLDQLLNENAHIIVAAGQDDKTIGSELTSHVESASGDKINRYRIGVLGSKEKANLRDITSHNLSSDRVIFVAPGINATDAASGKKVNLPGSYAAAAIAGVLSSRPPHVSLTNKTVSVAGLETRFTSAQEEQLVGARVMGLEERQGFRIVKGITTSTNTAWHQITTRRIVDYAEFGVRSASVSYIGLLNNDRVRKALKGSINGFLAGMVDDEMLISYELAVTATRDEEIRGIAKVTMTLRPTFSIDFIKVVMFLG